jgi:hypothetical protein
MNKGRYHHVPPCGGLHSLFFQQYCRDCQEMAYRDETLKLRRREIELLEILAEGNTPTQPRPTYIPPPSIDARPPVRRRGL